MEKSLEVGDMKEAGKRLGNKSLPVGQHGTLFIQHQNSDLHCHYASPPTTFFSWLHICMSFHFPPEVKAPASSQTLPACLCAQTTQAALQQDTVRAYRIIQGWSQAAVKAAAG